MKWRRAGIDSVPLLARMNAELVADEGHADPMTHPELEQRMRDWLLGEYTAVLFYEGGDDPIAYALLGDDEGRGTFVRQFFVARHRRRQGIGRRAFEALVNEVIPARTRVVVDVLSRNARALGFWKAVGFTDYARTLERDPQTGSGP